MNKAILIFGAAKLQRSLIEQALKLGLYTIGIDPDPNAECKDILDAFEVVKGDDFEGTLQVAQKYNISGVITAATDKPLIMMARVAERLGLPFFSVETAEWSTDKLLMKQKFMEAGIPCAKGFLLGSLSELDDIEINYPVIVKPRDNSGSRGVIYCKDLNEVEGALSEALQYTRKENVLVEEFIGGKEYSIESLHFGAKTVVLQFTEKITTALPYNVELGHNQPAILNELQKNEIISIISAMADALGFENCASHTELKINNNGIFVIETSPRLGGDFITSHLVPLSTGINMELALLRIAVSEQPNILNPTNKAAIIRYFNFNSGKIKSLNLPEDLNEAWESKHFSFSLKIGDLIPEIKNSLNRYGEIVFKCETLDLTLEKYDSFLKYFQEKVEIVNE